MKRKVIQLSTSTKVISLPSSWTKKNSVKKGSDVEVEEKDNLIIISKGKELSKSEAAINISGAERDFIWLILDGFYMMGFDELSFRTSGQKQRDTLAEASKWFPGLIIYDEKGDTIRLKNISVQEEFDLGQILGRIRNITITMIDDSVEAIAKKNWEALLAMKNRDYTINTYVSLAFRRLNKFGYESMSLQGAISQHIKLLEIFSDRLCIIFSHIAKEKTAGKSLILVIQKIRELYRKEAALISKTGMQSLIDFDSERLRLKELIEKESGKVAAELFELVNIFREMEEMAVQLGAAALSK